MEVIAIDTNIVLRIILRDDEGQYQRACQLFKSDRVCVPHTVILEAEWVLRSVFGFSAKEAAGGLEGFLSLKRIFVLNRVKVLEALQRSYDGFDFADALHYLLASGDVEMKSFDKKFVNRAKKAGWQVSLP